MKFEYLKEYKTRGGWKAVYMGESDGAYVFVHYNPSHGIFAQGHEGNGVCLLGEDPIYDIISEWSEPKTGVVYVYDDENDDIEVSDYTTLNKLKPIASVRWTEGEFVEE